MKRSERRMRAVLYGPLVPRLNVMQLGFATGAVETLSDDDYARLVDIWRQDNRLVPCMFRSPMEKWLRYTVNFERRTAPKEASTDGV